ncbi:TRAM domain-containing protein [bacterium]|nr:TRAM domain-containing protein [bacterium]
MVAGGIGIILGLIAAKLIDYSVALMGNPSVDTFFKSYSLLTKVVLAYIGMLLAIKKKEELELLDKNITLSSKRKGGAMMKVIDTSALIDGRIIDICETKFLEGTLVIPNFVLKELQEVSDSPDSSKRNLGRRGLDVLKKLQETKQVTVKIFEKDYPKIEEVDAKIIKLADELDARIMTADFNLNKVAAVQGIAVLNVNELSNAIKPPVLPGEAMKVFVLKEGKEPKQGVAYLDDGTMVVVEGGRRYIGRKVDVMVNSILQTAAGRMIFARLVEE